MIRLIRFAIVGGINTLVTLSLFYLLNRVYGINYLVSSFAGYTVGVVNSYILNKLWTFNDSDKKVAFQFIRFMSVNLVSLGINLFIMYLLVDVASFDSMLSQGIATILSAIINYIGSRIWVFRNAGQNRSLTKA